MNTLAREALRHHLILRLTPNLGPQTFNDIRERYELEQFCRLPGSQLASLGFKPPQVKAITDPDWAFVNKLEEWAAQPGQHIICRGDPGYPDHLEQISAAPIMLFVKGDPGLLTTPQLAMVGSRNLTITGQDNAYNFAAQLAAMGITITSGLAIGVDGYSHKGALSVEGNTIAVLGSGVEQVLSQTAPFIGRTNHRARCFGI